MFDVLMYMFENYIHSEAEIFVDHQDLTDELTRAGFNQAEICKALNWLEKLSTVQHTEAQGFTNVASLSSTRIYSEDEMMRLDVQSRGFLIFLEQVKVLNFETRELVIERVCELDEPIMGLEDLKWIVLMVLVNVPGNEQAYMQMEDLLFEQFEGPLH